MTLQSQILHFASLLLAFKGHLNQIKSKLSLQPKLRSYLDGFEIKIQLCFLVLRLHTVPSGEAELLLVEPMSASF